VPLPDTVGTLEKEALALTALDKVGAALALDEGAPLLLAALVSEVSAETLAIAVTVTEATAVLLPGAEAHAEEEAVSVGNPTEEVPLAVAAPVKDALREAVAEALCEMEIEGESEPRSVDGVAPAVAGALAKAEALTVPAPPLADDDALAEAHSVALDPLLAVGAPVRLPCAEAHAVELAVSLTKAVAVLVLTTEAEALKELSRVA